MPDSLRAGAICTTVVSAVRPSMPLGEAARRMRADHVGSVVVVDGDRPVGILTDRDIVVSTLALDLDARQLAVEDIMSRDVASVSEDAPFTTVVATMRERGVRRVVVTTAAGALVGLLTFDDVLAAMALQMNALTEAVVGGRMHEAEARA